MQVFAVVRIDAWSTSAISPDELQLHVAVKEIVATQAEAEEEVQRLTKLNTEKGAHYFWQATRYFPGPG